MKRMLIPALILLHYITGCSPSPNNGGDPNSNPTGSLMNLLGFSSGKAKELAAQASTQVSGILRDANDDPIANATLDLNLSFGRSVEPFNRGLSDTRTTTDSEGAYTLNLRLGKFEISVTKADGTKLGSFSMDVVDSKTPPTVATTSNLLKPSGAQIAGIGAPPPSLGNLKLESISYSDATIGQFVNITISPKITGGKPSSCSITPSLPAGLSFSNTTCRISGTPTTLQSSTTYTVTAGNAGGSVTGTVKITVILMPPSNLTYTSLALGKDRSTTINPTTLSGSAPTSCTANPSLPTGLSITNTTCVISGTPTVSSSSTTYTITATNSAGTTSATISLSVAMLPPSSLAYSGSPFTFTRNSAIQSQTPSYNGSPITSCSISPTIPTGLSLNTSNCVLTGTPSIAQTATNYTITATNSVGSTTTSISINIPAIAPGNLSYSGSPFTYYLNTSISSATPTYTGDPITTCSITPALPAGLSLNTTTCAISGTPTVLSSSTTYTVSASNTGGNSTGSLVIQVLPSPPIVSMPTGLLKTGQTAVYQTGDDGTYQKGIARTFTQGGTTGLLLWQRCSAGQNNDATCSGTATAYTWANANSYCSSLTLAGKTWRLPTLNELANLVDYGKSSSPTIDTTAFPSTQSYYYWSSSTFAQVTNNAWYVDFYYGSVYLDDKTAHKYVRCVTGP